MLRTYIRLADKKGLLKGHLNILQDEALQWLMIDEVIYNTERERERMKYTILAGNIQLYQELYPDQDKEDEEEIDWITPQSAEEIEQIEKILSQVQSGGEDF
jgi:hypothetical protein